MQLQEHTSASAPRVHEKTASIVFHSWIPQELVRRLLFGESRENWVFGPNQLYLFGKNSTALISIWLSTSTGLQRPKDRAAREDDAAKTFVTEELRSVKPCLGLTNISELKLKLSWNMSYVNSTNISKQDIKNKIEIKLNSFYKITRTEAMLSESRLEHLNVYSNLSLFKNSRTPTIQASPRNWAAFGHRRLRLTGHFSYNDESKRQGNK